MKDNNYKEFSKSLNLLRNNIFRGIQVGLYNTNKQIQSEIITESKQKKSGRVYRISTSNGKLKIHQASSPSETSAWLTGNKNKNIKFKVSGINSGIGVDKKIKYASYIEYGTAKMKAREDTSKAGKKICNKNLLSNIMQGIASKIEENKDL